MIDVSLQEWLQSNSAFSAKRVLSVLALVNTIPTIRPKVSTIAPVAMRHFILPTTNSNLAVAGQHTLIPFLVL
jgi:hypothetical protein